MTFGHLAGRCRAVRFLVLSVAAVAVLPSPAFAGLLHDAVGAPDNLKLSGSFRSRTDGIKGQFRPATAKDDQLWSLRTSLFAEYDTGAVRIGAEMVDARGYGEDRNSSVGNGEVDALELSQAYVAYDLNNVLGEGDKASVQAGRFLYHVGAGRLIAIQNFRNAPAAFTGVNVDWKNKAGDRLQALWAMPHFRLPDSPEGIFHNRVHWDLETTDVQLYGANFTKAGLIPDGGTVELYAFGLNERDSAERPSRNRHLVTPGIRVSRKPAKGAFDFDLEGIYQFGRARLTTSPADLRDVDVSAFYIHAEAGRRFDASWSPRVALLFDYGSGDGKNPNSYGRFDALYGSGRADLGPTSLYNALGRSNLIAPGVRFDVQPSKRWDAYVSFRELWLDKASDSFGSTKVRDRAAASGTYAGAQIEGRFRYWLVPKVLQLDMGAAYLAKGRFLHDAPNAPVTGDTRYAYADVTFQF